MGLIICPDCGGTVSDRAPVCPSCGCPFNRNLPALEKSITVERKSSFNGMAAKFDIVVDGIICGIIGNGKTVTFTVDGNNHHSIFVCYHHITDSIGSEKILGENSGTSMVLEIEEGSKPAKFRTGNGSSLKYPYKLERIG